MEHILTQREVCVLIRISYPTLARWLTAGTFPQPINSRGKGKKLLWSQDAITQWIHQQQSTPSSVTLSKVNSVQRKQEAAKSFEQRQLTAQKILERHRQQSDKNEINSDTE